MSKYCAYVGGAKSGIFDNLDDVRVWASRQLRQTPGSSEAQIFEQIEVGKPTHAPVEFTPVLPTPKFEKQGDDYSNQRFDGNDNTAEAVPGDKDFPTAIAQAQ